MARTSATASLGFIDPIIQAVTGAFAANPIYTIVILVIAIIIGWFLHYQVFGY